MATYSSHFSKGYFELLVYERWPIKIEPYVIPTGKNGFISAVMRIVCKDDHVYHQSIVNVSINDPFSDPSCHVNCYLMPLLMTILNLWFPWRSLLTWTGSGKCFFTFFIILDRRKTVVYIGVQLMNETISDKVPICINMYCEIIRPSDNSICMPTYIIVPFVHLSSWAISTWS